MNPAKKSAVGATSSFTSSKEVTSLPQHVVTRAYLAIWCTCWCAPVLNLVVVGPGIGGLDERPVLPEYDWTTGLCVIGLMAALGCTSRRLLLWGLLAHTTDLAIRFVRLPIVWDHEQWAMQVEMAFVVIYGYYYCFGQRNQDGPPETQFLLVFRVQFGMMYLAATFWKLNSGFFDPQYSCGSVLIPELVGTYLPTLQSTGAILWLIKLSPHITLLTEAMLGIGFLLAAYSGSTICRHVTIVVGSLFHLSIFLLPVNSAGGFSVDCTRHFILLLDSEELDTVMTGMRSFAVPSTPKKPTMSIPIRIMCAWVVLTATLFQVRLDRTGQAFDFGFFIMWLLCSVYSGNVIYLSYTRKVETSTIDTRLTPSTSQYRILSAAVLVFTFLYSFVGPILGVQHMGSPTMYSNLRYYHGGNHFLVPVGILPDDIIHGGGLVQIISSTSAALNRRLAYIRSEDVFPPTPLTYMGTAADSLKKDDIAKPDEKRTFQFFPLCLSNPHSRELLKDLYETSNPDESEIVVSVILPISEVRKALAEAKEANETFVVRLTQALESGMSNDDGERVVLRSDGSCEIYPSYDNDPKTAYICKDHYLAKLIIKAEKSVPAPLLGYVLLANGLRKMTEKLLTPYPQLAGQKEDICMS